MSEELKPFTSEEKAEYERILLKYKDNDLRDYLWSNLWAGELIRFIHYLVITTSKMRKIIIDEL